MATLQNIRNRAGVLIAIVIGLALAAFILGDIFRSGSTIFRRNQMEIGVIEGESIQYTDFNTLSENLGEIYKLNTGLNQLDETTWVQVREEIWQDLIQEIVLGEVYDELGIDISADELYDLVQGNNIHPIVQQLFMDPTTGIVDRNSIINFLKNLDTNVPADQRAYWLYLEEQIIKSRKVNKYLNLIKQGLYIPNYEVQNAINELNHQVSFDYFALNYSSIPDSTIEITERDLRNYYNEHIEGYKQEATRTIEYITFEITPSDQDYAIAEEWINDIVDDFSNAEDNILFTNSNSDESFDNTWYKPEELPEDISAWIFEENAAVNEIFGPYFENEAYKLAKLHKIEMMPDSVEARHILLTYSTAQELEEKETLADSLKSAIENGSDFAALSQEYSADAGSAINGGDVGWFIRGMMVPEFEEAAFNAERNEVVITTSSYGIHIIQTTRRGVETKQAQIATIVRNVVPSDATYQKIYAEASKFASENTTMESFNNSVVEQGMSKKSAVVYENDREIVGLENARQLIRAAFETEEGKILLDTRGSSIFELGNNYVIAILEEKIEKGYTPFDDVSAIVELEVLKEKKAEILSEKIKTVLTSNNDFAVIANELDATIQTAEDVTFSTSSITGIGIEPKLTGTVSAMELEQISNPIKGNNAVYLAKVTSFNEAETIDLSTERSLIDEENVYRVDYEVYGIITDNADIEDKRSKFF